MPQIKDGTSSFCPPKIIAKDEPYCLFLDELNACSHEVQKAFYSLINDRRIGDHLPSGSIIIGAGNRAQDNAIVKPMSSALINRMVHVHLKVSHRDWLEWAYNHNIHPWVLEYIQTRPDHLWSQPPKTEEPFSTPRSWHMLSDALHEYGSDLNPQWTEILASGCLTSHHATQFKGFIKQINSQYQLKSIIKGETSWLSQPEDRDVLYFLAQSFRSQLIKELPAEKKQLSSSHQELAHRAKALLKDLAALSLEIAQMVVSEQDKGETLPSWLMVEIVRDLPRLVQKK